MSNQEAPFSYTVKINNANLFTVRGDDFAGFVSNLGSAALVPGINDLIDALEGKAVQNVVQSFEGTIQSAPTSQPANAFAPIAPAGFAAPVPTATAVGSRSCQHGVMIQRTGNGAKGEWRAFFCPTPKGTADQCQAIFAKRGTPEWDSFGPGF
jgi:hypothetical protein